MKLQTCLNLLSGWDEERDIVKMQETLQSVLSQEEKSNVQDSIVGNGRNDPINGHALDSMKEVEIEVKRRTNSKTPICAIGQLEMKNPDFPINPTAEDLAQIYQNFLPSPPLTPRPQQPSSSPEQQTTTNMNNHHDLHDHLHGQPSSPAWTEAETLYSHDSAAYGQNSNGTFADFPPQQEKNKNKNPGLQLCLDLLTRELAGVFFQQHPKERQDRASRLQIQLMIEVYEDILLQLQQKPHLLRSMGMRERDRLDTADVLRHWLEVLYYLYEVADGLSPLDG